MAPRQLEALRDAVVGHVLLARLCVLVADVEVTAEAIALAVGGLCGECPRAFGVNLAQHFGIDVVVDGEVVAAVAQIEAAGGLVAVGRHDESAAVLALKGEEAIGDGQRHGHVAHDEIGGAEHDIFARTHLGARHVQVEVGVRVVAGGVVSLLHIHRAHAVALAVQSLHVAFALLGVDVGDVGFARLEVVADAVGLVFVAALLEEGLADDGAR